MEKDKKLKEEKRNAAKALEEEKNAAEAAAAEAEEDEAEEDDDDEEEEMEPKQKLLQIVIAAALLGAAFLLDRTLTLPLWVLRSSRTSPLPSGSVTTASTRPLHCLVLPSSVGSSQNSDTSGKPGRLRSQRAAGWLSALECMSIALSQSACETMALPSARACAFSALPALVVAGWLITW